MPPESDAAPAAGHTVSGPALRPPDLTPASARGDGERDRSPAANTIDADMGDRPDAPPGGGRRPLSRGRQPSTAAGAAPSLRANTVSASRSARGSFRPRSSVRPGDESDGGGNEPEPFVPPLIADVKTEPGVPPVPWLPFAVVNCIVFCEFLISGVAGPFLFSMIYDLEPSISDTDAATWAGVIAAGFFFAQFLTSLLWSAAADRYGRRIVLLTSAVGSTVSVALYGVSPSLGFALAMRLSQGFFNGAVGVAKGAVRDLTVPANEAQAFAVLGFWWGMGGIVGPILGGLLEHPVQKYPFLFGGIPLLKTYPYLLPCLASAACSLAGAVLAIFTGPNGGQMGEAFPPLVVTDESQEADAIEESRDAASRRVSYAPSEGTVVTSTHQPLRPRGLSSISFGSHAFSSLRRGSMMSRSNQRRQAATSFFGGLTPYRPDSQAVGADGDDEDDVEAAAASQIQRQPRLSFVQRFVLANDDAVHTLSDLWVASAINGEEAMEDPFLDDHGFDREHDEEEMIRPESSAGSEPDHDEGQQGEGGEDVPLLAPQERQRTARRPSRLPSTFAPSEDANSSAVAARPTSTMFMNRRPSTLSAARIPSIYRYSGLEWPWPSQHVPSLGAPSGISVPPVEDPGHHTGVAGDSGISFARTDTRGPLAGIPEQGTKYGTIAEEGGPPSAPAPVDAAEEDKGAAGVSLWAVLPIYTIVHYGVVGLHSSTFDQVFLSFLVAPVDNGGLGMTAAHYAELIAFMAFCQLGFQFYLYPWLGPPHGRLTHLGMLRLGLLLYLPTYTLFPVLRSFLRPWTEDGVMAAMVFLSGMRYLANICAYTAVSILMNALTPPHLVPLANGLAQTVSSAARFVGPLVGGIVWGISIDGGPNAHAWPFNFHLGFWLVGLMGFAGFVQSWWIR